MLPLLATCGLIGCAVAEPAQTADPQPLRTLRLAGLPPQASALGVVVVPPAPAGCAIPAHGRACP